MERYDFRICTRNYALLDERLAQDALLEVQYKFNYFGPTKLLPRSVHAFHFSIQLLGLDHLPTQSPPSSELSHLAVSSTTATLTFSFQVSPLADCVPHYQTIPRAWTQKAKMSAAGSGNAHHGTGGNSVVNDLLKQATHTLGSMTSHLGHSRYVGCILSPFVLLQYYPSLSIPSTN